MHLYDGCLGVLELLVCLEVRFDVVELTRDQADLLDVCDGGGEEEHVRELEKLLRTQMRG